MNYAIYFDESNKLDQPNGGYSYYGAFGAKASTIEDLVNNIKLQNEKIKTRSEMHFVNYTSDTDFEKYFKNLNLALMQDVNINLMIVNNDDAKRIAEKMNVSMSELRELFYVKIPERLFYGMTRSLLQGEKVQITIDENTEYEKLNLQTKLGEQMNAHSAYRNKGYRVDSVKQIASVDSIPLQLIDVFMGIVVFLMEKQYKLINQKIDDTALKVKSDLVYRILIHNCNLELFHKKVTLYKWEGNGDRIDQVNLSEYTGEFLVEKTQFDIQEMNKLQSIRLIHPNQTTKFYREKMEYTNRQLKTILGYIDELDGKGRNSYFV